MPGLLLSLLPFTVYLLATLKPEVGSSPVPISSEPQFGMLAPGSSRFDGAKLLGPEWLSELWQLHCADATFAELSVAAKQLCHHLLAAFSAIDYHGGVFGSTQRILTQHGSSFIM